MNNVYETKYKSGEIEYSLETEKERKIEEKRLKNLGVKFTSKKLSNKEKRWLYEYYYTNRSKIRKTNRYF